MAKKNLKEAKDNKDWAKADEIRNSLKEKGIIFHNSFKFYNRLYKNLLFSTQIKSVEKTSFAASE